GEPRGGVAAHPFREELLITTDSGPELAELYLSHNGGVLKERLAAELGLSDYKLYTDSHIYLKYLVRRLEGVGYEEAPRAMARVFSESKPFVKSALDLCILLNSPTRGPTLAAASYVAEKKDMVRWRYYEPVLIESRGFSGFVSSTVRDLLRNKARSLRILDGKDGFVAVLKPDELQTIEIP
ncbi:MAG: hypothetical protein QXJ80_07725, partial [Nitrososphaerota archaeon]